MDTPYGTKKKKSSFRGAFFFCEFMKSLTRVKGGVKSWCEHFKP